MAAPVMQFQFDDDGVYLIYSPEDKEKLKERFSNEKEFPYIIEDIFQVEWSNVQDGGQFFDEAFGEPTSVRIKIGDLEDGCYTIRPPVVKGGYSIIIDKSVVKDVKDLVNVPTFRKLINNLSKVVDGDIRISNSDDFISVEELRQVIQKYPSEYEISLYKRKAIQDVLRSGDKDIVDYSGHLESYLAKKGSDYKPLEISELSKLDVAKYKRILEVMEDMLDHSERIKEKEWQRRISQMILLIFPQYIFVTEENYLGSCSGHRRRVDFGLIDSAGFTDLIEIKKSNFSVLRDKTERNNYVPTKEVTDAIAQLENYMYCIQRNAKRNEKTLSDRFHKHGLVESVNVRIMNPRGMLILGRSNDFDEQQQLALEILRRQHSRILDIITYDDLIERLKNIIHSIESGHTWYFKGR